MTDSARANDRAALRGEWGRLFDRSALEQSLRRALRPGILPGELLGEGTHFRAFGLPGSLKGLVLSVAKSDFLIRPRFRLGDWQNAMVRAARLELPLLAPFEVLAEEFEGKQLVGLVQLYGESTGVRAAPQWTPLAAYLRETLVGLSAAGLELADLPQIRCRAGIPFIIDYSDLKETRSG